MRTDTRSPVQEQGTVPNEDPALFGLVQKLADNKYWLGRRYAEWCTAAPTLESAVAAAAMAQDEIGHARSHYPLFRQFVGHDVEPEDRELFHSLAMLDRPFRSWLDFVAANFLVDTALTVLFESATESSYDDLRNRARRIVGEEQVHWLHAKGWVKRLSGEGDAMRSRLGDSLVEDLPEVIMWFGAPDDGGMRSLRERGVVDNTPDELRTQFLQRIEPVMSEAGLENITSEVSNLPWSLWDSDRGRLAPET